ncbi:MAG: hypothetical protein M3P18_18040 [Actinomycetota bacterium]|nr:hypothetical protein [Actinomycetota bacterium]
MESWDARSSPSQLALASYLNHVEGLVAEAMKSLTNTPLSIELAVGLPVHVHAIRGGHDLDNYLYPLIRRLGVGRFVSARTSKAPGNVSSVRIARAEAADPLELEGWAYAAAETSASTATAAWKHEIVERLSPATSVAPDGPIDVQLAFAVSERRNWAWLWKPALDALGAIWGVNDVAKPFQTRDDRITRLAVHRTIDDSLGNRVRIGVWWRSA